MEKDKNEFDKIKLQFPSVSSKESIFYYLFYVAAAAYSLYKFYLDSKGLRQNLLLTPKNNVFGKFQDQMDWEWNVFLPIILESLPFHILHLILAQILRKILPKLLSTFYLIFSSLMLFHFIGMIGTAICFAVVTFMFLSLLLRSKPIIWICWCMTLIALNTRQFSQHMGIWLSDVTDGEYKTSVIVAWIILRSLSFTLESCNDEVYNSQSVFQSLINGFAYCFYFPLVITGPYMSYSDFLYGIKQPYRKWGLLRIFQLTANLSRFLIWMALAEFLLYHFYSHSLQNDDKILVNFDSWTMGGFVYFLLVFFFFKYVVFYGLTATFARFEGFSPPIHPKCILMVYKFTDVWRYFDNGLYKFMLSHIYLPFLGNERGLIRKLQGTIVVFTFIYVWHGVSNGVFWWTFLNFVEVAVEKVLEKIIIKHCPQITKENSFRWEVGRRVCFLIFGILIMFSTISVIIFVSSLKNAAVVSERIFISGFPSVTITTIFVFYCIAQCGLCMENWRRNRKEAHSD